MLIKLNFLYFTYLPKFSVIMNIKERVLDFKVYLPQLETEPGRFKGGVRRYLLHKNEDSPALVLGNSLVRPRALDLNSKQLPSLDNLQIKRREKYSISPITGLTDRSREVSPIRNIALNTINKDYSELLSHPAFRQPKYTKHNPKVQVSNPILGFADNMISLEKKNNLGEYGMRVLGHGEKMSGGNRFSEPYSKIRDNGQY
jgi:hypothetical protein